MNPVDLEELAFEGISIDFKFTSTKPSFGELFLIVGFPNPNFPPNSKVFEKLNDLGFAQIDNYFGIKNKSKTGDDVLIWLYPIIQGKAVYRHPGPFDAIRVSFSILRNEVKTIKLLEKGFNAFKENLPVEIYLNQQKIEYFSAIETITNQTVNYCQTELGVEPGSDEAMELD